MFAFDSSPRLTGSIRFPLIGGVRILLGILYLSGCFSGIEGEKTDSSLKMVNDPVTLPPGEAAQVIEVVDGDTIWVILKDREEKVRYIGVDTPELNPPQCYAGEAKERNRALVEGKTVYLEGDVLDRDPYERLLRYVWLRDRQLVNTILIREGYGRAVSIPPNTKYVAEFEAEEKKARSLNLGIWAYCTR